MGLFGGNRNRWDESFFSFIGQSRVRALPLGDAAERSVHYIWYYFSFSSSFSVPHTFLPEGDVLGFLNSAWSYKSQKE